MSESEAQLAQDVVPGGWARIWTGAALMAIAVFLLVARTDSYEDRTFWLAMSVVSGFFGVLHFIVGCVMHALELQERRAKISAQRS